MKPHKHAEVIKKWADGHPVQWREGPLDGWKDTIAPSWGFAVEFRVRPATKWFGLAKSGPVPYFFDSLDDCKEFAPHCLSYHSIEIPE